jgi:hypothetical protein
MQKVHVLNPSNSYFRRLLISFCQDWARTPSLISQERIN